MGWLGAHADTTIMRLWCMWVNSVHLHTAMSKVCIIASVTVHLHAILTKGCVVASWLATALFCIADRAHADCTMMCLWCMWVNSVHLHTTLSKSWVIVSWLFICTLYRQKAVHCIMTGHCTSLTAHMWILHVSEQCPLHITDCAYANSACEWTVCTKLFYSKRF